MRVSTNFKFKLTLVFIIGNAIRTEFVSGISSTPKTINGIFRSRSAQCTHSRFITNRYAKCYLFFAVTIEKHLRALKQTYAREHEILIIHYSYQSVSRIPIYK